jgi:RND superfamily putative drug exporter
LKTAIESTVGVAAVSDPQPVASGALHLFNVFPDSAPQDKETSDLVHRIRYDVVPSVITGESPTIYLTGNTPFVVDFADYIGNRLPLFIGAVLVLSFLLLMTVFHSIVVAAKAVIMNMLSIAASFGALVAVFQWGSGDNLIGLGREGPIEAWAPMMLFAILFGLSMDYEVFLLTRIREEYDRHGDNARAVADGLAATGRVITAAAAIMVCVFGAFVLGEGRDLKLLGFGLAFAIFIDATVVRLVLVPALMELMGKWNWYLPSWLRWLPQLRVDASEPHARTRRGDVLPGPAGGAGGD